MLICSDLQSVPAAKKKRTLEDVASEGKRIEGPLTAEYIDAMEEELKKQKEERAAEKRRKKQEERVAAEKEQKERDAAAAAEQLAEQAKLKEKLEAMKKRFIDSSSDSDSASDNKRSRLSTSSFEASNNQLALTGNTEETGYSCDEGKFLYIYFS